MVKSSHPFVTTVATCVSYWNAWVQFLAPLPANAMPGRCQWVAQVCGSLLFMQETPVEFWVPGSGQAQLYPLVHWGVNQWKIHLALILLFK